MSNLPWFNLSCQNLQPLLHVLEDTQQSQHQSFKTSVSQEASAYSGGSCIRFPRSDVLSVVQLYSAHLPITGAPLHVSYSVVLGSDKPFCLAIRILKEDTWNLLLLITEGQQSEKRQNKVKLSVRKLLPSTFDGPSRSLVRSTSWTVHKYVVEVGPCIMSQIYAVIFPTDTIDVEKLSSAMEKYCEEIGDIKMVYPLHSYIEGTSGTGDDAPQVLLGHLRISMTEEHDNNLPSIGFEDCNPSWSQGSQGQKFVSLNLLWGLQTDDGLNSAKQGGCKWVQFHVYLCNNTIRGKDGKSVSNKTNTSGTDAKYLGVAMVEAFNVHMLPVPEASSCLQFCVQPQCACGLLQSFTNAPICTIKVPQD